MEIITEWSLYVVISHFKLIVCDLEDIPSKTKGLPRLNIIPWVLSLST